MADDLKCERCGGPMTPGVPGDVVCLNDDCFKDGWKRAIALVNAMHKQERYKKYLELKEEFDDE